MQDAFVFLSEFLHVGRCGCRPPFGALPCGVTGSAVAVRCVGDDRVVKGFALWPDGHAPVAVVAVGGWRWLVLFQSEGDYVEGACCRSEFVECALVAFADHPGLDHAVGWCAHVAVDGCPGCERLVGAGTDDGACVAGVLHEPRVFGGGAFVDPVLGVEVGSVWKGVAGVTWCALGFCCLHVTQCYFTMLRCGTLCFRHGGGNRWGLRHEAEHGAKPAHVHLMSKLHGG